MGKVVGIAVGVVLGLGFVALMIADLPPVSWMNDLQSRLFGGYHFPQLTLLLLLLMVVVPAVGVAALFNAFRGKADEERRAAIARKLVRTPFEDRGSP